MNVTPERAEKALRYLAETDEDVALAKSRVSACEYLLKRKEAHGFLSASGNIEERRSIARTSDEYSEACKEYTDALTAYEHLKAKRETERLVWETWRSINASQRG